MAKISDTLIKSIIKTCKAMDGGSCVDCPFYTRQEFYSSIPTCYFKRLMPSDWNEDEIIERIDCMTEENAYD